MHVFSACVHLCKCVDMCRFYIDRLNVNLTYLSIQCNAMQYSLVSVSSSNDDIRGVSGSTSYTNW